MLNKKGFTLIEVLVVVVLIAIISMIAFPSFKKSREITKNEGARIKLLEVANAARMYNEDATQKVAGRFGQVLSGGTFVDPLVMFYNNNALKAAYLKNQEAWSGNGINTNYNGYTYYVCNPDLSGTQPISACVNGTDLRIAVMKKLDGTGRYAGEAWVSGDNLGVVKNNYDMKKEVTY